MASIKIYDSLAFDLDNFDLSELTDGESYLTAPTVFRVAFGDGAGAEFRGSGLRYDDDGFPTAGTVSSYTELDNGYLVEITGLSIKAKGLGDAAKTSSATDDRALFVKALGGDDRFEGGARKDMIESYGGEDALFGGGGADTINGGTGDDVIVGGLGRDRLIGGAGVDLFVFDTTVGKGNIDTIVQFKPRDDTVVLDTDIFTEAGSPSQRLASGAFHTGAKAHDASDRVIYNENTGALLYDPDGTGRAAARQFATVGDDLSITFKDFLLI